jgi:flagellar hook-basal body complex protein FliE
MIEAISAISTSAVQPLVPAEIGAPTTAHRISFEQLLHSGVETTNAKIAEADRLVAAFAVDDSIPAHQVTFALEEARLSLELMIQVRNKIIEGYQQMMNMQV